jgi:hypothetical protein
MYTTALGDACPGSQSDPDNETAPFCAEIGRFRGIVACVMS